MDLIDTQNIGVNEFRISVQEEWKKINLPSMQGTILIIGAPDTGKTTFARYLFQKLCQEMGEVAYLDGDPGQGTIGPPATMSLGLARSPISNPNYGIKIWRSFVGSVSPRGHMLQVLIGAWRLTQVAYQFGAKAIVYDTSGLVDPKQGGQVIKIAKIDMLKPTYVVAIQVKGELETILRPLRRTQKFKLIEFKPNESLQPREVSIRQQYRAKKLASYFEDSRLKSVFWPQYAVLPNPTFCEHRLIAFEDQGGLTRALGIVLNNEPEKMVATVLTPLNDFDGIDTVRLGNLKVNPQTFRDERLRIA